MSKDENTSYKIMVFVANLWRSSVLSARILFALQPMQSPKRKGVYSLDGRISTTKGVASGAEFDLNAMKLNAFYHHECSQVTAGCHSLIL